jgi:hypothetical protein
MKLFNHIESGFYRALKGWKGVLLSWVNYFLLISAISIPLKGSLSAAFGRSMITENLSAGLDIEIFTDLDTTFKSIISSLSLGIIFILITGFIINAFLTGGLFNCVRKPTSSFSASVFFQNCASRFWSFLLICLSITITFIITIAFLIIISSIIIQSSETISELAILIIGLVATTIFLVILPIFLLSADYGRAWISSNGKGSFMKAIGMGFRFTFKRFWTSYFLMVFMIIIQGLLVFLALEIIPAWHPSTAMAMLALFIVSQFAFFVRLLFRTWRYGGVTSLIEDAQQENYIAGQ